MAHKQHEPGQGCVAKALSIATNKAFISECLGCTSMRLAFAWHVRKDLAVVRQKNEGWQEDLSWN